MKKVSSKKPRERNIRKELKKRVEAYGGEIRAVSWLGRAHAPDVLCLFPPDDDAPGTGTHIFVETKAPDGEPSDGQLREHERMRASGCVVLVVSTIAQLDSWMPL